MGGPGAWPTSVADRRWVPTRPGDVWKRMGGLYLSPRVEGFLLGTWTELGGVATAWVGVGRQRCRSPKGSRYDAGSVLERDDPASGGLSHRGSDRAATPSRRIACCW